MQRLLINDLHLWQFDLLKNETSVRHFVSDRESEEGNKEFTLSYSSSPDRELVNANRAQVARAMGVPEKHLFLPSQVHKTYIVTVTTETTKEELLETDALITNQPGVCIAVMSADCVPVLLYDRKNHAVAAIHSGWRGTVAHILEKTLLEMKKKFGTSGSDLLACIGPSVSQDSYEVGVEVVNEVRQSFDAVNDLLIPQHDGKAKLDLWKANEIQLHEFGVPASQIEVSNLCTVKNNNHFFSARKGDSGRFAAGIVMI